MSDLLIDYRRLRDSGMGHHSAVRQIDRSTGIGKASIERLLDGARKEQARPVRRPAYTPTQSDPIECPGWGNTAGRCGTLVLNGRSHCRKCHGAKQAKRKAAA